MIEKLRRKNLTFLPTAVAVGFMLFCVALGLTASLPALADVDTAWDTKVVLSTEEPVVGQGHTVTLNAVVTTQRTNTYWSYLSLQIVPLKEDGTLDQETAEHLSVAKKADGSYDIDWGNLPTGRQGYTFYPVDGFQGEEKGVWLTFMFLRGTQSYATTNDIHITVKIQTDETTPVGNLRFGLLPSAVNEVCFGATQTPVDSLVGGTAHTDAGILTCQVAEVKIRYPYLELTQESTYQFLYEWEYAGSYYRVAYPQTEENWGVKETLVHGVNDSAPFVVGQILPQTTVAEFLSNIKQELRPYVRLFSGFDEGFPLYDRGEYVEDGVETEFVGTGYYIEFGAEETPWETVYLSVLGDINGDGYLTTDDVDSMRDINRGLEVTVEYRLAAYILNHGFINASDVATLNRLIGEPDDVADYYWYPPADESEGA